MPRKKNPDVVEKEQRIAKLNEQIKKWKEEEEHEKAHHIVLGVPRRPRKWATATEPKTITNEDGTVKLMEPEWYIDEYGREVQLITIDTDWSLVDRYYPTESRYKYFDPPKSLIIPNEKINTKAKPYKMKASNTRIIKRPLYAGEKERDAYYNRFVRALEEREEKIKSGKLIVARKSFLWKN